MIYLHAIPPFITAHLGELPHHFRIWDELPRSAPELGQFLALLVLNVGNEWEWGNIGEWDDYY